MESEPKREFGKRRPAVILPPAAHPVKRSGHVALLLMGTLAVGGGAFALMPGGNCQPKGADCTSQGSSSSGGHGGSSSRSNFFSGDASSNRSPSGTSTASGSGTVTRGGFGSYAQAFAAHFSGGS
jgi:hypothetical protein